MNKAPEDSVLADIPASGGQRYRDTLTPRQQMVLDIAWAYWSGTGELITFRKLNQLLGHSAIAGAYDHVAAIEKKGIYFPRSGKPAPYTDDHTTDTVEVERLRSLYWMHKYEASTGRAQGKDKKIHNEAAAKCLEKLAALGKRSISKPLEEKNE